MKLVLTIRVEFDGEIVDLGLENELGIGAGDGTFGFEDGCELFEILGFAFMFEAGGG